MRRHREFRTERLVLEYYDAMAEANSPESARKHPANASTGDDLTRLNPGEVKHAVEQKERVMWMRHQFRDR